MKHDDVDLTAWQSIISDSLERSLALCWGLFRADGSIVQLNAGLNKLLGGEQNNQPSVAYFVMPTFEKLWQQETTPGGVYEGWFTFGGLGVGYCSLRGQSRRQADQLLVLAEYDVVELVETNQQITDLNSEITNLQRELSRKKLLLEQTLAELRQTQAMLIHSEKMNALGQLTAGVAHEINNPISFVASNLHTLQEDWHDIQRAYTELETLLLTGGTPEQQNRAKAVRQEADLDFLFEDLDDLLTGSLSGLDRVKAIVENLRTFTRLDEAKFKEADLNECLTSTLAIAEPQLSKRLTVEMEVADLSPLYCNPAELNQVFMNLMVNAAQAMENDQASKGKLTIRGQETEQAIILEFADTGQGIPPDVLPKIFDPFFTTKPVGTGTGLGLSLAYRIIQDHHQGTIEVDSKVGQGTTFILTLPKGCKDEQI